MTPAEAILADVTAAGGCVMLRPGGVQVEPPRLLDSELRWRIRLHGEGLLALLQRGDDASPSLEALAAPAASCCELRRFPDWNPSRIVRFCCEPSHWHEDGTTTFGMVECELLATWAQRLGVRQLSSAMRDALLALKIELGGRIDAETVEQFPALQ